MLFLVSRDDDERSPRGETRSALAAEARRPGTAILDPATGARVQPPRDWHLGRRAGALRLTAPDRSAIVSISAPGPAADLDEVLGAGVTALAQSLRDVRERRRSRRELAGLPATEVILTARNAGGERIDVVVVGVRGRRRAYLVEAFLAEDIHRARLREAQAVLSTLALDATR